MTEPFREAEHDTDADHLVETQESLRDEDPEAMPMDRDTEVGDRPLGAERFGTTSAEQAAGESLDQRLAQEVPDVGEHDPVDDIVAADPATFAADAVDAELTDEGVLDDAYGDSTDVTEADGGLGVGRLVEPDEGVRTDTEKDVVATDVGRDGGGVSAEEAAMHVEEAR